jgi:FxLD family lantipeptide
MYLSSSAALDALSLPLDEDPFSGVEVDAAEFDLDLRVVEAAYPIAKLLCDTSDQCGSTCSGSACNTSPNGPF